MGIPEQQRVLFERAQKDMDLISSGQPPINCKFESLLLDGGTKTYRSDDYEITEWKQLFSLNDVIFQKRGISITFKSRFPGALPSGDIVANTWLEPVSQPAP